MDIIKFVDELASKADDELKAKIYRAAFIAEYENRLSMTKLYFNSFTHGTDSKQI